MYTIFSCPKDFTSLFGIIQRNAIHSWLKLSSKPKIILFGNFEENILKEFDSENIVFLSIDDVNEYETPFINKIFEKAIQNSTTDTLCYVNSDIILFDDFSNAINILEKKKKFFGVGRRFNVDLKELIKFENKNDFQNKFLKNIKIDKYVGSDYFIFNKNQIKNIPSFLIGRTCWDNWLMYYANKNKLDLIDCTNDVFCVHQKHDYSHIKTSKINHYKGIERGYNFKQLGGLDKIYDIRDCNFILKRDTIKRNYSIKIILHKILRKSKFLFLQEYIYQYFKN